MGRSKISAVAAPASEPPRFTSYRLALVFNQHQVATEAGTSGAMIHQHYRALVTPEEAAAWFAIRPESGRPKVKSATEQESPQ